jgi:hypothetical protein
MFLHLSTLMCVPNWQTTFCQKLSLEMECGAFSMIQKANDKVCNGNSWHTRGSRKLTCQNHKWRLISSLPLISRLLFTLNSLHKAKHSTKLIMSITETEHPPYSPDLAPNELLAASRNKVCFKRTMISGYWSHWKLFHSRSYKCFQQWQHHWAKSIAAQGEYFEGDPSQ